MAAFFLADFTVGFFLGARPADASLRADLPPADLPPADLRAVASFLTAVITFLTARVSFFLAALLPAVFLAAFVPVLRVAFFALFFFAAFLAKRRLLLVVL